MYSPNVAPYYINSFLGGLNVTKQPTEILDHQTPSGQNYTIDELQNVNSRHGYSAVYSTSLQTLVGYASTINGLFMLNAYNTATFVIHYGTGLYKDLSNTAVSSIYSGLSSGYSKAFEMGGYLYLLDASAGLIQFNGTTLASSISGYVPVYKQSDNPSGENGTIVNEINYLTTGFRQQFNANGSQTIYTMAFGSLTTSTPIIYVNNILYSSGAGSGGFTVNWASGKITFTTAPTTGTNNVDIQVYKNFPEYPSTAITNCRLGVVHGEGNVQAFLGMNSNYPNTVFYNDVDVGASYFPSTSYDEVGSFNDKITGLLPAYNGQLVISKERSIHLLAGQPPNHSITHAVDDEGNISTDSLSMVDGNPTFMSQRGIVQLKYNSNDEKYILDLISEDINGITNIRNGVMTESLANRELCIGHVFDNKYWLYLNSNIWLYHYNLRHKKNNINVYPWLKWNTFSIKNFITKDGYIYFGGTNNLFRFNPTVTNDNGTAIDAYITSKETYIEDFFNWIKWFIHAWFDFRARKFPYLGTDVTLTVYVDGNIFESNQTFATTYFDPDSFDPDNWAIEPQNDLTAIRLPISKKGRYIQIMVRGTTLDKGFTLAGVKIDYVKDRIVI